MLKFFKLILLISIFSNMAWSDYCTSDYNCSKEIDKKTRVYELQCTLPSENAKMRIIAPDVFEADGTLKTYFGTGENVCNVLGWMDEGAKHFNDVNGLVGSYTEPITLEFKSC